MDSAAHFSDLGGQKLRIGIRSLHPTQSTTVSNSSDIYNDHAQFMLDTVDLLSSRLNFTYQLVIPPGVPNIGIKEANGSWTGLIGLLERHEVDVVVDRIPFLNYYRDVIDFSVPLAHDNWVTLQRQSDDSVSMAGLSSPFQLTVWLFVALSVILMIPIMYIIYRIYLKFQPNSIKTFQGKLGDFTMFVVFSLLKQDYKLRTAIHSQRVLMVTWWIGGILLTTFYTAHLTASLARPIKAKPIQRPEELLLPTYQKVKWVALEGGPYHGKIRENTNKANDNKLNKDLEIGRGVMASSIASAVELVEKDYIWFGPSTTLLDVIITNYRSQQRKKQTPVVCAFLMTEEKTPYLSMDYGFGFSKNSSLTSRFNHALETFVETGFFDKKKAGVGSNPCSQLDGSYSTEIAMHIKDFIGLFSVTIGGIVLSAVTFIGERVYYNLKQSGEQELNGRTKSKVQRPLRRLSHRATMEQLGDVDVQEVQRLKITVANIVNPPYRMRIVADTVYQNQSNQFPRIQP